MSYSYSCSYVLPDSVSFWNKREVFGRSYCFVVTGSESEKNIFVILES